MSDRLKFPEQPIDGRPLHAHHYDGSHGCADHFRIERHRDECLHRHEGVGHLISLDIECGFQRDEAGAIVAMRG